jgi:hypothetical protein
MLWIRLLLSAILASELILRLPLLQTIGKARVAAAKSARLLQSRRVSDHWKERMLPVYAGVIARNSLVFFGLLCAAILPVVLIGLGYPGGPAGWIAALMRPVNLMMLFGLSVLYLVVRTRLIRVRPGRG